MGQPKNYSGTYYFGRVMTVSDVRKEVPNSDILISNMGGNGWKKVIRTRRGNFQPFGLEDKVVAEK